VADVFPYLPNLKFECGISFEIPMNVNTSDYNKEQRLTTSDRQTVLYGSGNSQSFYRYDALRRYRGTWTEITLNGDFQMLNRLRALRGSEIYLPFFLEPLAATGNLSGQTTANLDVAKEMSAKHLKFMSPKVIRLRYGNRGFFEVRDLANTYQDVINNERIVVSSAWTASIDPGECRLFFADTVYNDQNLPRTSDSDRVHDLNLLWQSL